jgi:hypothetical protein
LHESCIKSDFLPTATAVRQVKDLRSLNIKQGLHSLLGTGGKISKAIKVIFGPVTKVLLSSTKAVYE